ncbi:MAG: hypothetical protein U1F42_10140 [Candidatus Competibacteraceae bacterium]
MPIPAPVGIDVWLVSVEVHLSGGLPGLFIVGLPEAAVKESMTAFAARS